MFAPYGAPRIDGSLLLAKASELDATIQKLEAMRQGLRHAAACKARTHMECPTFRRLLKAAASGRWGREPTKPARSAADRGEVHDGPFVRAFSAIALQPKGARATRMEARGSPERARPGP